MNSTLIEAVQDQQPEEVAIILGALLFVSEVLPLIPYFKNNGFIHSLVLILQKLKV